VVDRREKAQQEKQFAPHLQEIIRELEIELNAE